MEDLPEHMPAAVLRGPGRLEVSDVPVPAVGADDVLVAVELCGICGSDLHMVLEGWGAPGSWQGHEWIGTVAAVGDAVTRWQPGDIVVGGPTVRCGSCPMCVAGRPSLCQQRDTPGIGLEQGAFATFKLSPSAELLALPAGLDRRAAALAEPLAVALHGIHQGRVEPGQRVLVLGAGPIGALSIAALRALGVDDVACAEPSPARRALATAAGATTVVHPDDLVVPSIAD
ncbi:MAG: alcohol dehydrogenase catalytic domain-containing protein, partial [Acidimicrobiales bacterium]